MGWLKTSAPLNMPAILVTNPVFQVPMGWLNSLASLNIKPISVTVAVFQVPMLAGPVSKIQLRNIWAILVTPLKLGTSVAVMSKLMQPKKALFMDVQAIPPHWLMSSSFWQSPPLLKKILGKLPRNRMV